MFQPIWPPSGALNLIAETAAPSYTVAIRVDVLKSPLQLNSTQILYSFPLHTHHVLWIAIFLW
jgi:hypothetical protein